MINQFSEFGGESLASIVEKSLMPSEQLAGVYTPSFKNNPFQLGVASGDPLPNSVVLWTRLAPSPLAENGLGGMPDLNVVVEWEIAKDPNFHYVVQRGSAGALPELNHAVHVEVDGLEPDCFYYYRFQTGSAVSPIGRTKTLPAANSSVSDLSFAMASCQAWYDGYYTAYQHMAADNLDFVMFFGNYIYEYPIDTNHLVRQQFLSEAHRAKVIQLNQYRLRYALFKTDPDLQAAHAAFPWIFIWDDEELDNQAADANVLNHVFPDEILQQRTDAYQAYYENLPLRSTFIPETADTRIYRKFNYGNLAEFNILDTRQYRNDGTVPSTSVFGGEAEKRRNPELTMLGNHQEKWLMDNLTRSQAVWNVLAQTVMMTEINWDTGLDGIYSIDHWDGYVANRNRIFDKFKDEAVNLPIVLTGDIHRHVAAELKEDFQDPDSATVGTEFVTTSISSGGDGADKNFAAVWQENKHVPFYNAQRGYIRCQVTHERWQTDHLVVPYVSVPGAPIRTCASFTVENGKPGLQFRDTGTGSLSPKRL
ncbi:alkaline phosphatase D [Lentibacillus persicus]|uniref:Alkaline phosphatase D n=1 Tax=Lentibacillus persicus TaxID=640948 RepID=A0A1I2A0W5_9BACI|nr:alkaline phosphatase D family protein [Lentibacillus persicus]SFE37476.1 alkaline phosphatase D [Lentibacillus persicus]